MNKASFQADVGKEKKLGVDIVQTLQGDTTLNGVAYI